MSTSALEHDVIIVGAGMVGGAIAGLLARSGLSVAVVEYHQPEPFDPASDVGLRVSAISPGSANILRQAGAWASIEKARCCHFDAMHVEEGGQAGGVDFQAAAFGLERLGSIVENDLIQDRLWSALQLQPLVDVHCPDKVHSMEDGPEAIEVRLESGGRLRAALLIACDGAVSRTRRQLGIRQDVWEYNQHGLVAVVRHQRANPRVAWQRFLPGGPLAFLPLADGRSSMVWTLPSTEAKGRAGEDSEAFLPALAEASNDWLGGPVEVGPRGAFPLAMRLSEHYFSGRAVLLGDAAHAIHPLAGQGVNLGLADAAALVETLIANRAGGRDLADPRQLTHWQRWRRSESELMARGMHALHALFTPPALSRLRGFGLGLVGRSWLARDFFIRRAAGLSANAPRLSRGEDLRDLLRAA